MAGVFLIFAWSAFKARIVNVVTYDTVELAAPMTRAAFAIPCLIAVSLLLLGTTIRFRPAESVQGRPALLPLRIEGGRWSRQKAWFAFLGVGVLVLLSGLPLLGRPPSFLWACAVALCTGWVAQMYAVGLVAPRWWTWAGRFAPALVGIGIVSSTVWHAAEQFNFFQHFSLGHADLGFFVTELEHCLPWKDVPDRFADTRMGYHCIPLFYALVPIYALVRSPVFLMVVGPLALNLAAVPFYQLARHRGASRTAAALVGVAWLALPSISRLPYANTYGFQSIYLAVPWLAFAWSFAFRDRWRASHVCLAGAMLCEETVCGVAFGWGLYLALCTPRRRDGVIVVAASLAYLALCTLISIPYFAAAPSYTRLGLFGDATLSLLAERLFRRRAGLYLVALLAPLALGIFRNRASLKLLIVAAPTLLLVLLLQNDDYLNIKYWHQSSVLPALFTAAVVGVGTQGQLPMRIGRGTERSLNLISQIPNGASPFQTTPAAIGLLLTVLLLHQLLGFSPVAQAYRPYVADAATHLPGPRMEVVHWVRSKYPRESTTVLATERMAAHFCDYRGVYHLSSVETLRAEDLIIVDRSDTWDPVVRGGAFQSLIDEAVEKGYQPVGEFGPILVLEK